MSIGYEKVLDQRAARALWEPEEMTVGEVAEMLYPHAVYDTALPLEWVQRMRTKYNWDPNGHVVWHVDGYPMPLTKEAVQELYGVDSLEEHAINPLT